VRVIWLGVGELSISPGRTGTIYRHFLLPSRPSVISRPLKVLPVKPLHPLQRINIMHPLKRRKQPMPLPWINHELTLHPAIQTPVMETRPMADMHPFIILRMQNQNRRPNIPHMMNRTPLSIPHILPTVVSHPRRLPRAVGCVDRCVRGLDREVPVRVAPATDRRCEVECRVSSDRDVREIPAVGVAADGAAPFVGDPLCDGSFDDGDEIAVVLVTAAAAHARREGVAAREGAAVVGGEDGVA